MTKKNIDWNFLLFKPEGTIRGVTFAPANGKRKDCIMVVINGTHKSIRTSLGLSTIDFYEAYEQAVTLVREAFQIPDDSPLIQRLRDSHFRFLEKYNLTLEEVKYYRVKQRSKSDGN